MSNFKVGDLVCDRDDVSAIGQVNAVKGNRVQVYWDGQDNGDTNVFWPAEGFSLIKSTTTPIRTVTRKEIVAGKYGIVDIADCTIKGTAAVMIAQKWTNAGNSHWLANAAELREAAHTLNQIAEALDET